MKILIVDDNEENVYMLQTLLRGNGHEVISARDGMEALDLLKSSAVDMIISDILMPRMDGFQLCREVRAAKDLASVPFAFYTATYTSEEDRDFALNLGADWFFLKPDDLETLLKTVRDDIPARIAAAEPRLPENEDEIEFCRQHNKALFQKLEKKIADLDQARQTLQASLQQMGAILNNIPDMAWLKDTEGRFIAVNEPFGKVCGLNPQDIVGKTDPDIWPQDLADHCSRNDRDVIETKQHKRVEELLVDSDGKKRWFETIRAPVFALDDSIIGTTGISRDITERRKLEYQLRQAQKMEAVGQLAGGIAHDFNNVLNVILGFGKLVQDRARGDPALADNINEVLAAAKRAANLTRRLLIFSRRQPMEMRPVDINKTIADLEKMLARLIGEDITLALRLTEEKMIVLADSVQIEQVLMNLATNARDAMPKGGGLTISTAAKEIDDDYIKANGYGKAGRYVLISVTDTGGGMDSDTQSKIFEPFFTTKGMARGTGLGLSIAYGIIEQHNGYLRVISEVGRGTTFSILLPIVMEEIATTGEAETPVRGGTETILVAEDDPSLRKLETITLESFGYTVITAADGEEAIWKFMENKDRIMMVIFDMIMPKKSGREAYDEIKRIRPDVKSLFATGYTPDIITQQQIHPEIELINKPVAPKDLLRKVREVLDA